MAEQSLEGDGGEVAGWHMDTIGISSGSRLATLGAAAAVRCAMGMARATEGAGRGRGGGRGGRAYAVFKLLQAGLDK